MPHKLAKFYEAEPCSDKESSVSGDKNLVKQFGERG